jgi:tetratricopeptide (TPR) repeat protein
MTHPPQFEYDVFISYSSADQDWVRGELLTRLERAGLRVCIDFRDFQVGVPSVKEMERALLTSRKTILVLTPNYLASAWTEFEALMLQTLDPANRQARLLPILKEKCALPLRFQYIVYADFTDAANLELHWTRLLNAIQPVGAKHASPLQNAPIPRPPPYGFVPRYDESGNDIAARVRALLNQNRAVVLVGDGGVGKTTLAAEIARAWLASPDGKKVASVVVWASADGRPDFSLGTVLDLAAEQLGRPDVRPLALEQKMNAVRDLVGAPFIVPLAVIDNFETIAPEQQRAIADFINTLPCAVLITSRANVEGAERVKIATMSWDEARDFLRRAQVPAQHIDAVATLAERNPAVMRWIVGQLNAAQRLSDIRDALARGHGDAAARVFGRSFGLLNDDARATLLALGLFTPSARRPALAYTAGLGDDIARLNAALAQLATLQLLETSVDNECLAMVGLTRRFTLAQLNNDANAAAYRQRFVDYFVDYAEAHAETTPDDLNALEDERENLLAAMDVAFADEDWQSVMRIADVIAAPASGVLSIHGYWDDAIARGEQAAEAARRAGDESAAARFEGNAATILTDRGEYAKARETHERVLETYKRLGDEASVAVSLHQLGVLAQAQGDYATAQAHYAESLDIFKKLGDQRGIALTTWGLGNITSDQGNYAEARKYFEEALQTFRRLGDQKNIAGVLHQLGMLAQAQGDYATARAHYAESLEIAKKLGDQSGIAITLHQLGMLAQDQGDYATAQAHYAESLEIKKKLGDQSGIARTLHQLGMLAEIAGDKAKAAQLFREALEIFERLKSPDATIARRSLERVSQPSSLSSRLWGLLRKLRSQ